MSAPRSLDEARRDGWSDEPCYFEDFFGVRDREMAILVEDEPEVEVVSPRLRELYRSGI